MNRATCIILLLFGVACVTACGGSKSQGKGDNTVSISGEVVQEGQTSLAIVLLRTSAGRLYLIQSSAVGDELRSLVGMRVMVHGQVVGELEGINVVVPQYYELLPFAGGERPIVGWVRQGGLIYSDDDVIWKLEGDFKDLLATFVGSKVWVVGIVQERVNTSMGAYRVLDVTDYGVIRQ